MSTKKRRKFRVYVEQVNQTYVEVFAKDPNDAVEKGYRKWRKEYAHSRVSGVCDSQGKWSRVES